MCVERTAGFRIDHGFVPLPRDPTHVVTALVIRDGDTIHLQNLMTFVGANERTYCRKRF